MEVIWILGNTHMIDNLQGLPYFNLGSGWKETQLSLCVVSCMLCSVLKGLQSIYLEIVGDSTVLVYHMVYIFTRRLQFEVGAP